MFFHNSLIVYAINYQIVFGCFELYLLIFINIKSDMKTAQKIVNNLINKNTFLKTRCVIFGDNQIMSKHIFHIQNPSIYQFQLDLYVLHLLICKMGMRYVSLEPTIQFSICKISYIGCVPPIWTVWVSWYVVTPTKIII